MFLRSSNTVLPIGIDIGSSGVKVMQLQTLGDHLSVRAAAKIELPPNLRRDEERWAFIIDAIKDILKNNRFKGPQAVTSVPNHAVQFKSFRVPRMPAEELTSAVMFEAEERFAFQSDDAEYRYLDAGEIRQGQETRQEIIAMGCTGQALRHLLNIFKKVGLVCQATDVGPCAVVRCFHKDMDNSEPQGQPHIYADFGDYATRIIITVDAKIVFVKSVAIGGQKLNEMAARVLNLPLSEASQLRRDILAYHCDPTPPKARQDASPHLHEQIMESAFAAIRPAIEEIGKEISLCLRYYAVTFRGLRPDELVCIGGHSYDPQLLHTITEVTGVQAVKGAPLNGIDVSGVFSETQCRSGLLEWATAAGLSLRDWAQPGPEKEAS